MAKNQPFSGYHNRATQADDPLLTEVGPGTPGGGYLRRYWHPFMLASELGELPVAIRLLGEELVVFHDGSGRLGLLHKHCAHRGASLEFGRDHRGARHPLLLSRLAFRRRRQT